ncbi:hypothetical protein ACE6H2_006422 [Prunus campanulata]
MPTDRHQMSHIFRFLLSHCLRRVYHCIWIFVFLQTNCGKDGEGNVLQVEL